MQSPNTTKPTLTKTTNTQNTNETHKNKITKKQILKQCETKQNAPSNPINQSEANMKQRKMITILLLLLFQLLSRSMILLLHIFTIFLLFFIQFHSKLMIWLTCNFAKIDGCTWLLRIDQNSICRQRSV